MNTSEPVTYFWYRYLDLICGSKYMVSEMDQCEGYINCRRARLNRIEAQRDEEDPDIDRTEDARELQEENNQYMAFDCKGANA